MTAKKDWAQTALHPHAVGDREVAGAAPHGRRPARGCLPRDRQGVHEDADAGRGQHCCPRAAEHEGQCESECADKRTDTGGDIRTTAQRRKIYALCEALGWNDDPRRIQGFVKRVAHVDRIEWLNMAQCEKVIEGLKAILARQRRKEAEL